MDNHLFAHFQANRTFAPEELERRRLASTIPGNLEWMDHQAYVSHLEDTVNHITQDLTQASEKLAYE